MAPRLAEGSKDAAWEFTLMFGYDICKLALFGSLIDIIVHHIRFGG